MKSEKFYLTHRLESLFRMVLLSATLTIWSTGANAQCALACNNLVQVSMDDDCIVRITPDMMLEGQGVPALCDYKVQVLNANGTVRTQPEITSSDIGKTLTVRVLLGNNSCWGLIKVEDKLAPRVNCQPKREVACWDPNFDPNVPLPKPSAIDNCDLIPSSDVTIVSDVTTEMPCTSRFRARRIIRYQAVDKSGNKSVICSDTIDYVAITLANIRFPKNYDSTLGNRPHLSCDGSWVWGGVYNPQTRRYDNQYQVLPNGVTLAPGSSWDTDGDGYPDPEEVGAPFVADPANITGFVRGYMVSGIPGQVVGDPSVPGCKLGAKVGYDLADGPWRTSCDGNNGMQNALIDTLYSSLKIGNTICKINTTWKDTEIPICAQGFKILREWTIIEWCSGAIATKYQIIKVVDDRGPIATIPTDVGFNSVSCAPDFSVSSIISANPYTCTGEWIALDPIAIYDCSDSVFIKNNYTVQFAVRDPNGTIPTNGPFYYSKSGIKSEKLTSGPNAGKWRLSGLPLGCTWIKYTLVDECGNTSEAFTEIQVEDRTPPVAVCDEFTVITLSNNGEARAFALSFDDGSHDNCTDVGFEVARMQSGCGQQANVFGPFITVCCEDITRQVVDANRDGVIDIKDRGHIQVILKVWDDANGNGIYGDKVEVSTPGSNPKVFKEDNFNTCMVIAKIEDKTPPIITCPKDVVIECGADTSSLIHGRPVFSNVAINTPYYNDNCPGSTMSWRNSGTIDNCGQGVITRTFTVYAAGYTPQNAALTSFSCQQRITIRNTVPYNGPRLASTNPLIWLGVENRTVTGCLGADTDPSKTGVPVLGETACSQVAYTYEDQVFNFVENVCYKILRKWTVIDWCKFAPNVNPQGQAYPSVPTLGVNMWTYTQTIKVSDNSDPVIAVSQNPGKTFNVTGPGCGGTIDLIETATDCSPAATAALKWTYLVDLYNDGVIINTPSANSNNNSIKGNTNDASGTYPVGTHKITWTVEDQCGNQATKEYTFIVRDDKKPTPYCLGSLVTVVMPVQRFVELWAKDYDKGSTDNCPGKLYFTFNGMSPVRSLVKTALNPNPPDIHYFKGNGVPSDKTQYELGLAQKWSNTSCSSSMYFDCDDAEDSPFPIDMSVWDTSWNTDYCTVTLDIQANTGCTGSRVAGNISRSQTEMIKNVQVSLRNVASNENKLALSDVQGKYEFFGMSNGSNYVISPEKDDDALNGVSTLDLVMIQRHILGINKFDAAQKYLAGDINKDEKITASDLTELRKLILGIYDKFPNNKSWRFYDKNAQISDISSPWTASQSIAVNNFGAPTLANHFTAVKVGDINSSATINANAPVESRSNKTLTFIAEDAKFNANDDVIVNVTSASFDKITGAQWTLTFDPATVEFKSILPGTLKLESDNINSTSSSKGTIAFSWNEVKGKTFKKDDILFTIVFKATTNQQLSKIMNITSDMVKSEAYTDNLQSVKLAMEFSNRSKEIFALGQNNPNPFTDKTTIGFTLPNAGVATINIYDLTGKVVRKVTNTYPRGLNEVVIKAEDLQTTGVLFYELESQGFKSTKKMIYLGK